MTGAAVVAHQNKLMRRFNQAGATSASSAQTLAALGVRPSFVFRRMVARGIFLPTDGDRYYMDVDAASYFIEHRRGRILRVCGIMLIIGVIVIIIVEYM